MIDPQRIQRFARMPEIWQAAVPHLREYANEELWKKHFSNLDVIERDGQLVLIADELSSQLVIERDYRTLIESVLSHLGRTDLEVEVRCSQSLDGEEPKAPPSPQLSLFEIGRESRADDRIEERNDQQAALRLQTSEPPATKSPSGHNNHSRPSPQTPQKTVAERASEAGLTAQFVFDTFVVGSSNELAFGAASAVAEKPGTIYNPLFVYGGVGLGKTHLLHAIGHRALEHDPTTRVRYLSAENFVNELVNALQNRTNEEFRQKTRTEVDLLLIDDIQFIAGKERTQEEFFHMFNSLHQAGKQIVVTSDRIPIEIYQLQERIQSRLNMGLITDIQPPDLETRMAIIKRRAIELDISVPEEVVELIARTVRSNVRELHGTLNRLSVLCKHRNETLTKELAREQLSLLYKEEFTKPTPEVILKATAEYFHVKKDELLGRRRTRRIAEPRKIAMYVAKKWTEQSYPELGRFFGDRDHTTVLAACKSIEEDLEDDFEVRQAVEGIERVLGLG
jgi:chromosomal replication initiator protein